MILGPSIWFYSLDKTLATLKVAKRTGKQIFPQLHEIGRGKKPTLRLRSVLVSYSRFFFGGGVFLMSPHNVTPESSYNQH
jgi:hypothetical protein